MPRPGRSPEPSGWRCRSTVALAGLVGVRSSGPWSGAGRLAAGAGAERRARLGARAPARGDASLPRSARRRPAAGSPARFRRRSAATSSPPRCTASTVRWPSAVRGSRDRPPGLDPSRRAARSLLLLAGARGRGQRQPGGDRAVRRTIRANRPLEAQLRDPGLLAAVDQAQQGRGNTELALQLPGPRGAPSGSRSCRCGCAGSRPR